MRTHTCQRANRALAFPDPAHAPAKPTYSARGLRRPAEGAAPRRAGAGRRSSQRLGSVAGAATPRPRRRLPAQVGRPARGGSAWDCGAGGWLQAPGAEWFPPPKCPVLGSVPAEAAVGRAAGVKVPVRVGASSGRAMPAQNPLTPRGSLSLLACGFRGITGGRPRRGGAPMIDTFPPRFHGLPLDPSPILNPEPTPW